MATIYINSNDAYRTRVEDITIEDLFFSPIYKRAQACAKEIIDTTKRFHREQGNLPDNEYNGWNAGQRYNRSLKQLPINPLRLKGYPNNIIAFSAHRGHGKTSAMLSFAYGLTNLNTHEYPFEKPKFWDDELKKNRYYIIDAIDPTTLEAKDSIIRTIISRMFTKFVEYSEAAYRDQSKRDAQQRLLQKFQTCYRLADMQKTQPQLSNSYDDLQLLSDHGDSSNFKERFYDLIHEYLGFMDLVEKSKGIDGLSFLVLQIDDADMNTAHAYEVVDDIRKYCMVPNVIILFATDLEQLKLTVEQHFVDAHKHILSNVITDDPDSRHAAENCRRSCRRIAASYLDKLIPGIHRISLPDIDAELRNPMREIYIKIEENGDQKSKQAENKATINIENDSSAQASGNDPDKKSYQNKLLNMLQCKTLLKLQSVPFKRHPFLPKRMRELNHFVNVLNPMPNITYSRRDFLLWAIGEKSEQDIETQLKILQDNLEKVMDYFLNDWMDLQLRDSRQFKVIDDIHRATADAKLDAALKSIDKRYRADKSKTPAQTLHGSWKKLTEWIDYFRTQQEHEFAFALEFYFLLYRELMVVHDCFENRNRRNSNEQ